MTSPLPPLDDCPVAVKPLEWTQPRGWPIEAKSVVGSYKIWAGKDLHLGHDWLGEAHHASIDDAKAAAQADYEQRIRSALVPVAAPVAAGSDEVGDLVKRLREPIDWQHALNKGDEWQIEQDRTEAATRLTADKAEIARLTELAHDLDHDLKPILWRDKYFEINEEYKHEWARAEASESRCAAVMAERDGMAEALKPFAAVGAGIQSHLPDDAKFPGMQENILGIKVPTIGDFRRAALEAQEAPDKQA